MTNSVATNVKADCEKTEYMDGVIHLDIERLPGKYDGEDTIEMSSMAVENEYPNNLRVDYRGVRSRGRSAVLRFRVWLNDPNNLPD